MMQSLVQAQETDNAPELYEIAFQPTRLAAGPDAAIRDITEAETIYMHDTPLLHRADCLYQVNGDSMEPTFHNGDMVFVEYIPNGAPLQFGEIGAFAVGNECYIKEYQPDGLHSHNDRYPVMRFNDDASVYLIGRVLGPVDPEQIATEKEIRKFIEVKDNN
jgi:phage repressor protein C with HTH and peptisase S24 domain